MAEDRVVLIEDSVDLGLIEFPAKKDDQQVSIEDWLGHKKIRSQMPGVSLGPSFTEKVLAKMLLHGKIGLADAIENDLGDSPARRKLPSSRVGQDVTLSAQGFGQLGQEGLPGDEQGIIGGDLLLIETGLVTQFTRLTK